MLSKTCNDKHFDDTIKEFEHSEVLDLANNNCLRIYTLPMRNNEFDYINLQNMIKDNIKNYVFSRKKINDAIKDETSDRLVFEAIEKFREIKDNGDKGKGGELGEVLLYIFLESQLNAKKVLSKMELKTSRNDYVKGADGVFIYSYINGEYNCFDFIIGESKLQDKIDDAIKNTFNSIKEHLEVRDFEYNLISDNIFKESVTEEEAEKLKKMIIPCASNADKMVRNDAFGIFIGYTLDIDLRGKNHVEAIQMVNKKILNDIKHIKEEINSKIIENNLFNYSFYIYILPFNKVSKDRENIMKNLGV